MKEYMIGTGGWAYFRIPGLHPLLAYSRAFNFVEVNSTFYKMPSLKRVEEWRRIVPEEFQFAVRAHRAITHKHNLKPTKESLETFTQMRKICEVLEATIMHLQTPPSFKMEQKSIDNFRDLLSSVDLGKVRIALETRGVPPDHLRHELVNTMQEYNMIHCIDLSKDELPACESNILYSRLFGKGHHNIYQPTDGELKRIDQKVTRGNFEKAMLSFHFVRMYKDASRLKIYKQTGKFPKVTRSKGFFSLEETLREDTRFPATKQELIDGQGWKLFDLTENKRVRVKDILERLPEREYGNSSEVIDTLKQKSR